MIGRKREQVLLGNAMNSTESEFIMVYGRRRVGKTYLLREYFKDEFVFSCTGIAKGTRQEQLVNFHTSLIIKEQGEPMKIPKNWMEAFGRLKAVAESSPKRRKVIFLDEVPWMYTQKSDFLKAIEHFWNGWASARKDIILIVCGSAASWMVKKMVRDKGGLHDRVTLSLKLKPFTLGEVREFLVSKGIFWDNKTVAECYMILGGIPYYLNLLDKSVSLAQNIDNLFFSETPLLGSEFGNLYASLFKDSKDYVKIVEALSKKKSGFTRDEIVSKCKFKDGGGVTEKLEDLQECDFIRKYDAKGDISSMFQLTDQFTLFYYSFIKKGSYGDPDFWMHTQGSHTHDTWAGLSFEKLCFTHTANIKKALGIDGISTKAYAYFAKGSQIDMILERADRNVNVVEIKYSDGPFVVTPAYAEKLNERKRLVASLFKKRMTFSTILITVDGAQRNESLSSAVQRVITLDELF